MTEYIEFVKCTSCGNSMIWLVVRTTHNYWGFCQKHKPWEQRDTVGCSYDPQLLSRLSARLKIITNFISALCEQNSGSLITCIACEVATEKRKETRSVT